ncbi:MAG: hypothetical protein JJE48_07255 [Actinobacteria bacterium]|nr:hypothetical protein [Actinomycetota bacterium]
MQVLVHQLLYLFVLAVNIYACPLYDFCVDRGQLGYCGLCGEFPRGTFTGFYDSSLSDQ